MASGSSGNKQSESAMKKSIAALTPKNYSDPYGSFNGSTGVYSPNLTPEQTQTRTTGLQKINDITSSIPTSYSANDLFNNPYYGTMSNYYNDVLNTQRESDEKALQNNLAARNQIGSSYDALQQKNLQKTYSSNALAAEAQARGDSANYYTQNLQNQLNSLQYLRNDLLNAQAYENQPFQNYLGYQTAVSPLQQKQSEAYQNLAKYYSAQQQNNNGVFGTVMRFVDPLNTMQLHNGNFGSASQGVSQGVRTAAQLGATIGTMGGGAAPFALAAGATQTGQYRNALPYGAYR